MKKIFVYVIWSVMAFMLQAVAFGQTVHAHKTFFDVQAANKQFDEITKKLSTRTTTVASLIPAVRQLESLQEKAEFCVTKSSEQLKQLNELLNPAQLEQQIGAHHEYYQFLQERKTFYALQLASCRLFMYRTLDVLTTYKDSIQKLSTRKIITRSVPIWELLATPLLPLPTLDEFKHMYAVSGVALFTMWQAIMGAVAIAVAFALGLGISQWCRHWLEKYQHTETPMTALAAVLIVFSIPFTLFSALSLFLAIVYWNVSSSPLLEFASYAVLSYISIVALSRYLFYPPYVVRGLIKLPTELGRSLHQRFMIVVTLVLIGYLAKLMLSELVIVPAFIKLLRISFMTLLSITIVWFFWLFTQLPILRRHIGASTFLFKILLIIILLSFIIPEWSGFHPLAIFLLTGVLLTLLLLGLLIGALQLVDGLFIYMDDNQYRLAQKLRTTFGVKPHKHLQELILLRFVVYAISLIVAVLAAMRIWGVSVHVMEATVAAIMEGFTVVDVTFIPARMIAAIIVFCAILLAGRFLAARAAKKRQIQQAAIDVQVAVSSIIFYASFAIALLFALLVGGLNFTGLAIIAGALSVGAGLGLQGIVNNFVSGLILLLEKPIKPGDRIVIGETEGFVKKVRIRSTQITTLAKEDVIVPNSDLVTYQVTNYMFRDMYWRVVCQAGVAYGSDIHLVRDVLLDVAAQHDDVVQEAPNEPLVLFRSFGDNSLQFELWCIIRNVNKKYKVISDLNFAIDTAFRKNNITIAFPQRDIHVKEHITIAK